MRTQRGPAARRGVLVCALAAVILPGCGRDAGPDLGTVSGTVLFEDAPLAAAGVEFQPQEGRPSYGRTDGEGRYELVFTATRKGALVGEHRVRITTYREDEDDEGNETRTPERVPAKYNVETELVETVQKGPNTIDFNLKNDGPVRQPE